MLYNFSAYHGTVTSLQEINPYKWKQTDSDTSDMYKMPWAHVVRLLILLCSFDFMYGSASKFVLVLSAQIPNHAHHQIVMSV